MSDNIQKINQSEIVPNLYSIQKRTIKANSRVEGMLHQLKGHKNKISEIERKSQKRWFTNAPTNEDLFDLIKSDQKSNNSTTSDIGNMIRGVNENTNDLAQMIQSLAIIATMNYKDLENSYKKIEGFGHSLTKNFKQDEKGQAQLKEVIKLQIDKAKQENEKNKKLINAELQIEELKDVIKQVKLKNPDLEIKKNGLYIYKIMTIFTFLVSMITAGLVLNSYLHFIELPF